MYELWTDGACIGNPGAGGWAYILVKGKHIISKGSGYNFETTNNRMEMIAPLEGLKTLKDGDEVLIHSDSMIFVNGFNGRWKRKANQDIWADLLIEKRRLMATAFWIKGHSGIYYNEMADSIADERAREALERNLDRSYLDHTSEIIF